MDPHELRDLQDAEAWEADGEVPPAAANPRAVVSVSLTLDEVRRLADDARDRGITISELIRRVALAQIKVPI